MLILVMYIYQIRQVMFLVDFIQNYNELKN